LGNGVGGRHALNGVIAANERPRSLTEQRIADRERGDESFVAFSLETPLATLWWVWCHASPQSDARTCTMTSNNWRGVVRSRRAAVFVATAGIPGLVCAQSSPFLTGATALQSNILAWLTPIAVILVMVLGAMAMANRMSWGWCIGAILGIAIAFGAPQIVTWVRGMFGV
jgi:type IV secretion system protein VirB2